MIEFTPYLQMLFWTKVDRPANTSECWEWNAYRHPGGYGSFKVTGMPPTPAHRVAYELLRGQIPDGLQIDHLCRNRGCVNPDHLEPVTSRENTLRGEAGSAINARKTHCKYGHPFAGWNLIIDPRGRRRCRTCAYRWNREARARARAEAEKQSEVVV